MQREAARSSLLAFTEYTNPQYVAAGHHKKIAQAMEALAAGDIDRLMIFMPPRHGKSELASRRFPPWYLGNNPDKQIIAASYNADLASDFGRDVRNVIASSEYGNIFDVALRADSRAANRWHTNQNGVYFAAGVGGAVTGRGANIGMIDDPFKNMEEADSEVMRESVWKWYTSTFYTRLMPKAGIALIQTRWHDDDLAGRLLNEESNGGDKWHVLELPAISSEGTALWPEWYPMDALERIRGVLPPRQWNALYQQNPIPDDGEYFKRDWFYEYDDLPQELNYYITHDDAVTDKGGDYTEIGVWGIDSDDNIYAVDWWSGQETSDVWLDRLIDLIKRYSPFTVIGESGPIRRAIEPFLLKRMTQRKIYTHIEWMPSINNKSTRSQAFQGLASMGKVFLPKKKVWADELMRQLMRFPAGKYDDKVDACALIGRAINRTWAANHARRQSESLGPISNTPTVDEVFKRINRSANKYSNRRI